VSAPDPTLLRLQRGIGDLATAAVQRMDARLDWFGVLSPADRSMVGLVAQAGIAAFVSWYRRPGDALDLAREVFGAAPRELTRSVSLQQTLQLLRTVVDVVDERASLLAAPGAQQAVRESVLRFAREIAFAAAQIYAEAAEARGAWDARLEALVVDALVRGEPDETLASHAAALGWHGADQVVVVAAHAPTDYPQTLVDDVRRCALALGADALVGVQGDRLLIVLGGDDPLALVPQLLATLDGKGPAGATRPGTTPDGAGYDFDGPVVTGPVVAGLAQATRSARAALTGLMAARAWPGAPRPVAADDLLPERLLAGDATARRALIDRGWRPLLAEGGVLLTTAASYLETGRSIEGTARALFVHPNTVRYRLRRITAVTGWDPTDPRHALVLQLAIAAGRLGDR
jgi:DNA-binding PucR family transcriptional regulator